MAEERLRVEVGEGPTQRTTHSSGSLAMISRLLMILAILFPRGQKPYDN